MWSIAGYCRGVNQHTREPTGTICIVLCVVDASVETADDSGGGGGVLLPT